MESDVIKCRYCAKSIGGSSQVVCKDIFTNFETKETIDVYYHQKCFNDLKYVSNDVPKYHIRTSCEILSIEGNLVNVQIENQREDCKIKLPITSIGRLKSNCDYYRHMIQCDVPEMMYSMIVKEQETY